MSQNLDATAINQIHALISAQGVNEIISKIGADAVALPENFRIHDLEKFNLNRFRFRGALSTASIDDFTRYSKDLADEGTRCFIDADNMRAVSVLNLGTIDEPGHADNTATLKLKKTAPFSSLDVRDDIERRAYEIALLSLEVEPDEREAYELFMEKRFGDLVDRRRAKNGDNEYMAWDMTLGWIVWQQRAGIHFSTMSQQEVK
ncbi:TPA: DUF2303 family protein [Escherichia coli]|nr:DUF2303 family protein [Escherichia coli]